MDWLSEELLNEISEEFGDVLSEEITEEEMEKIFSESDDIVLNERNVVIYDRQTKLKTASSKAAMIIAHQNNDKFYYKMKAARKLYLKFKARILKKYGARGLQAARSNKGIAGLGGVATQKSKMIDKQKAAQLQRIVR